MVITIHCFVQWISQMCVFKKDTLSSLFLILPVSIKALNMLDILKKRSLQHVLHSKTKESAVNIKKNKLNKKKKTN